MLFQLELVVVNGMLTASQSEVWQEFFLAKSLKGHLVSCLKNFFPCRFFLFCFSFFAGLDLTIFAILLKLKCNSL